jgi:hypothetical protein
MYEQLPRKTLSLRLRSLEIGGRDNKGHYWVDVWLADKNNRLYHYYCPSDQNESMKTKLGQFFSLLYGFPKREKVFWNITARVKEGTKETYLGKGLVREEDDERTILYRPQMASPPKDAYAKQLYDALYKLDLSVKLDE